jgi:glycosidase
MKKILLTLITLIAGVSIMACNNTTTQPTTIITTIDTNPEYKIVDEQLTPVSLEDQYRVYYEIFVGSFSDSNNDGYGDLQGIINRFDYLNDGDDNSGRSLGIEGIWLMPIMPSPSYHKYDVLDYKAIDPNYGTIEDFENFTTLANERDVRVIIDLVLNHTSSQHPWFKAARLAVQNNDFDNKYVGYYTIVTEEQKESGKRYYLLAGDYYYEGNFSSQMPELNLDNEDVRDEIKDIVSFWFEKGVAGFRLDAAKYPYLYDDDKNIEFWNWFVAECKKINPDAYIVGEVWSGDSLIAPYYESFSNFDFGMSTIDGAVTTAAKQRDDVNYFVNYIDRYRNLIEAVNPNAILTPFISNHDMDRAAGYLSLADYEMHMAANLYMLTYGNPFIYYGEEIGMKGSRSTEMTDANRRLAMLWGDGDTVTDPVGTTYSSTLQTNGTVAQQIEESDSLYNHYKKLIMIRKANPEIARGNYTALTFQGYYNFGGFLSTYEESTVGIFHNTGSVEITINLSGYTEYEFSQLRAYIGQGTAILSGQTLTISPKTSVVLK